MGKVGFNWWRIPTMWYHEAVPGHLSAQAWRAIRFVVDIGLHMGYEDENGKVWNYDSAVALLVGHALKLGPMGLDPFATEMSKWGGN